MAEGAMQVEMEMDLLFRGIAEFIAQGGKMRYRCVYSLHSDSIPRFIRHWDCRRSAEASVLISGIDWGGLDAKQKLLVSAPQRGRLD